MREVLSERRYKAGYVVRKERIKGEEYGGSDFEILMAYTPSGDYIGDPKIARFLCVKKGIHPEKAQPEHNVCSIGFNEAEQKWYGWSHRAIHGFGIGSVVEEEEDISLPVGFTAKNLDDAKQMAVAFAESVS